MTTAIFDTTLNIESLAATESYERIGSLVFWEFQNKHSINHSHSELTEIFKDTALYPYIMPVGFSDALRRFAESVVTMHGNLYGRVLDYLIQRDESNAGYYYVVFFTGKVDKKTETNFSEHAKVLIGDDGNYKCLMSHDKDFLISSYEELKHEFDSHWRLINKDVMASLSNFANVNGCRFNSHGGHYFIPHKYTEDLYKIKNVLKEFEQKFSITPLIAGCDEDIEEIVELLGADFKKQLDTAEKELFEMCIHIYNYSYHWDDYVDSVNHRDVEGIKANRISKTVYGRKLTEKILKIDGNASQSEYDKIVKGYMAGIKPNKNKSVAKIYGIRDSLKDAILKLDTVAESKLINKWRNRMLGDYASVNATLEKVSNLLLEETLSIL